jgi:myo-inositol 2-dehydrogenase/D-chiro-inositol 1-dehydrogenase
MRSVRIGVLGTGRIGVMHARNLAQTAGVDEVVLMGRDQARLGASVDHVCAALQPDAPAELAGNLAPRGRVATVSAGAGLAEELAALDGVVVATSTSTHPAFALQIARAGLPSLVEKPLALDPGQLTTLADQLDDIGTEIMVAFHCRYDPGHQLLRQRILAGDAGTCGPSPRLSMITLPSRPTMFRPRVVSGLTCSSTISTRFHG